MSTELALFNVAKEALAEARRVDEVKDIRDRAEQMRLYGRQVKDRTIVADAVEIIMRAERRLGELLIAARDAGQIGTGRPGRSNLDDLGGEEHEDVPQRVTLEEIGISKDMSSRAQKLAAIDAGVFEEGIEQSRSAVLGKGALQVNPIKAMTANDKKARRAQREAELGAKQMALPEAKFGVILTDDEWDHETWSENGKDRAPANHYPVSSLEELKKRDVASLAADDCVLFMWCTVPHAAQGMELMAHRGFTYKSQYIWRKIYPGAQQGTGYWSRVVHEILLIGTRGNIPAPAPGTQWESVIDAPVAGHSAKPEKFYELIEAYFPTLPKIELNARVARDGWVRWGYEAPPEAEGAKVDFSEVADLREVYETEIQNLGDRKGKLTQALAEPLLRKGRAAGVSPLLLSQDLGHPLGTVKTWLNRCGLTSLAHMHEMNAARAENARGGAQ